MDRGSRGGARPDFACLNKVELLPWDGWGMMTGPHAPLTAEEGAIRDDVAKLVVSGDFDAIRDRYETDDGLRVPADITTFSPGQEPTAVHLEL